ncbi:MAG TPA: hypothetical protein ENJ77_01030 [Candidatus Moranbacteria bacterium]|nr:hypothetical protein [Candidatus Moranbacteria bacterium]
MTVLLVVFSGGYLLGRGGVGDFSDLCRPLKNPPCPIVASTEAALEEEATVQRVIDGDTVVLADGRKVRYIGTDSPEMGGKDGETAECYADEATAENKRLVEGRTVIMRPDKSDRDRYGRLLRYLWVDDQMINEELVRRGAAVARDYPPNTAYSEKLAAAEESARVEKRGLWGKCRR